MIMKFNGLELGQSEGGNGVIGFRCFEGSGSIPRQRRAVVT